MLPVVEPFGTEAVIWVDEFTVKLAAVPLNVTADAPVKPVPVMVTEVPQVPLSGVKLDTTGTETVVTVKLVALVPYCSE